MIKQKFTFFSKSPVKSPPPWYLNGALWSVFRSQRQWFIRSFIRVSQSPPVKELTHERGGKHIVTFNGDPRGRKAVIQRGAPWFLKGIVYYTAVTTPEVCRVHLQANLCGNCSGQERHSNRFSTGTCVFPRHKFPPMLHTSFSFAYH